MGSTRYIQIHMEDPLCHTPVCTPVCTPVDFSNAYIKSKNEDNASKLPGYDPWGLQDTSRMSWMTHCAYPCLYPCSYLVCTPDFANAYISAKNEDNATKLSEYDSCGLQDSSRKSWMTHCAYFCLYPCLYP